MLYTHVGYVVAILISYVQSKLNCEVLSEENGFEVRWAKAGDTVVIQLVAILGLFHLDFQLLIIVTIIFFNVIVVNICYNIIRKREIYVIWIKWR